MQIFPEIFVETEELAEEDGGEKKRNGESGGVDGQEKNAAGNGFAGGGESENGGEYRADAGRPSKGEGKAEEKTAEDAGLGVLAAEMDVAVEPAGELRAEEADQRERKKVACAESGEERAVVQQ